MHLKQKEKERMKVHQMQHLIEYNIYAIISTKMMHKVSKNISLIALKLDYVLQTHDLCVCLTLTDSEYNVVVFFVWCVTKVKINFWFVWVLHWKELVYQIPQSLDFSKVMECVPHMQEWGKERKKTSKRKLSNISNNKMEEP